MSSPRTIHEYLLAVQAALGLLVEDAPEGGAWEGLEIHPNQRYGLRGQTGLSGATGRGTLNLAIEAERGGDWAGGDPAFSGFALSAELMLPAKTAAQWTAAEARAATLVADLREALDGIDGTGGAEAWSVEYVMAESNGTTYMGAVIEWRSTEG